jgi:integrase
MEVEMSSASPGHADRRLDSARVLRPHERERLREHMEGQLALAKARGSWRPYRDSVFCLVLLATGIRVGAACQLHRADVRVGRGERELRVRRAKGGKPRKVRVPEELRGVLQGYLAAFPGEAEAPLFPGTLTQPEAMSRTTGWRRWKKALQAVGLDEPGRGCHAARHGLGLALWKQTHDLRVVAAQLGHRDLRSTMVYTAPLPEDVDAALDTTW